MKFPLMLRKTHEEEINRATNIIVEKNRVIAVKKDELAVERKTKARLQERLTIAECKLKKLEEYIEKLEKVSEHKTLRNCSLNTKLIAKDTELKKLDNANKDLDKANRVLIEGFNSANRINWCNEESKRQIKKLAEDILEVDKINKNEIASYLLDITKYMGGGMPIDIQVNEEFGK